MKHPGIYLHTNPADSASPLWIFHWSSLTLARLALTPDPVLVVHGDTAPPDAVLESFGKALDAMAPGMSEGLTMVTSTDPENLPPGGKPLVMAPLDPIAGFAVVDAVVHRMAIGWTERDGSLGPIWKAAPASDTERSIAIHKAWLALEEESAMDTLRLEVARRSAYGPGPWLQRPDIIARSSRPSPSPASP